MSSKFVSLYGTAVLLTVFFFHFLPAPEMLSWHELLLSKLLNQTPTLLCLGYLLFQEKRIKSPNIFYLLIAFLSLHIISEIYYYIASSHYFVLFNILNNILTYVVLLLMYNRKRIRVREPIVLSKNLGYAILACALFIGGFGFSLLRIYQDYMASDELLFWVVLLAALTATTTVGMSFFVHRAFSRNWYKLVIGTIAVAAIDVYVYLSIFVFVSYPYFIYTIGKVIFSLGILLIVETSMRKCMIRKAAVHMQSSKMPNNR